MTQAVEYTLGDTLKIETANPLPVSVDFQKPDGSDNNRAGGTNRRQIACDTFFTGKALLTAASSVASVSIQEDNGQPVRIAPSADGLNYEIK